MPPLLLLSALSSASTLSVAPTLSSAAAAHAFGPLAVPPVLASRLSACGFVRPMPIQERAMPLIAEGQNIVLHSATGSGKTLAFLVPLLSAIEPEDGVRVIIAAPSQELAVQIAAEAERLLRAGGEEDVARRSRVLLAISSSRESELEQHDALFASSRPPQLVVGTPSRLADLCRKERARPVLRNVRAVVLDEVDLMLPPLPAQPPAALARRAAPPAAAPRGRGGGRGARQFRTAGGRGRGGGRGADGGRGTFGGVSGSIERRLARKRPAELLIERVQKARPRSAPPLQLVSCSATISPELRRQIGALLGGHGKRAAGTVVTADPAHPPPASLKKFGVAGVQLPSTIT
jgi:hypothetical protein